MQSRHEFENLGFKTISIIYFTGPEVVSFAFTTSHGEKKALGIDSEGRRLK
jgi:hypothetical protein